MAESDPTRAHRRAIQQRHRRKLASRTDDEIQRPAEKRCSRCDQVKPASEFGLCRSNRDGLKTWCRVCRGLDHLGKRAPKDRKRRMGAAQAARLGIEQPAPPVEDTSDGPIMRVPLASGGHAIIDAADWPLVAPYPWTGHKDWGYAMAPAWVDGKRTVIKMHRLIFGTDDPAVLVDHKDGDNRNNRRRNLRVATPSESSANRGVQANNRAGIKGVFPNKKNTRWSARIQWQGTAEHLGTFDNPGDAADAYDAAAAELHGEFARLNRKS